MQAQWRTVNDYGLRLLTVPAGGYRFKADLWSVWKAGSAVPGEVATAVKVTAEGFVGVIMAFLRSLLGQMTGTPAEHVTSHVRRGWANAPRVRPFIICKALANWSGGMILRWSRVKSASVLHEPL